MYPLSIERFVGFDFRAAKSGIHALFKLPTASIYTRALLCPFISGAFMLVSLSLASAQQPAFRIATDINFGEEKAPAKQSLTLFSEGVYYDFSLDDPNEIAVIDPQQQRIILLDIKRSIKTTINTTELQKYVDVAKQQAASTDLALLLTAADTVSFDEATGAISVGIDQMHYRSTFQEPQDPRMATQYADFANWSARLNAAYPPHRPPYVRMRLNDELGSRNLLPHEIVLTKAINGKADKTRCRLIADWQLTKEDQARIKSTNSYMQQFNELSIGLYFAQQKTGKGVQGARQ